MIVDNKHEPSQYTSSKENIQRPKQELFKSPKIILYVCYLQYNEAIRQKTKNVKILEYHYNMFNF